MRSPDLQLATLPMQYDAQPKRRSATGVSVYVGDWAVGQLWLFWIAPIVGAILGAMIYRYISGDENT